MNTLIGVVIGFITGFALAVGFYDIEIAAGRAVVEAANHMKSEAFNEASTVLARALAAVRARL